MKLSELMAQIKGEIVNVAQEPQLLVLTVRFKPLSDYDLDRWMKAIQQLCMSSLEHDDWAVDISRVYLPWKGQIVYFWRWMLAGDTQKALRTLQATIVGLNVEATKAIPREFDEWPLRGRINYVADPATGKIKGAWGMNEAARLLVIDRNNGSGGAA